MGRYVKNTEAPSGSYAIRLPVTPSAAVGPDSPVDGQIRFNQGLSRVEMFFNSVWNQIAKIGKVSLVVDDLVGDGTSTNFTMSQAETDPSAIAVFIGGVYQQPTTNYTVSGTTISFTSAPPAPGVYPNKITIIHNLNSTDAS